MERAVGVLGPGGLAIGSVPGRYVELVGGLLSSPIGVILGSMKFPETLKVTRVLLANRGVDMFIDFLGFLVCIGLIDFLKELSKLSHHLLQLLYILLCFFNGCMKWLVGIGGCEGTELVPKLEAGIL
jgi:hypothetical protein